MLSAWNFLFELADRKRRPPKIELMHSHENPNPLRAKYFRRKAALQNLEPDLIKSA